MTDIKLPNIPNNTPDAVELLDKAARCIGDRAKERDTEEERSMNKTVRAFNAITGKGLDEGDGWIFMVCLKLARSQAGCFVVDDFIDMAAYAALAGECASNE